ncbi:MAG: tetratricopeptide repeat protein [Candidatus Krumholzibacteriota bacterium]|nr:tetratricopeptide repeat protein [Candidatus Krumholzibacteriota bacterium]
MRYCKTATIPVIIASLVFSGSAWAESGGRLVARGNREFAGNRYEKAAEFYEKASVKLPESAIVAFNLGDVFYRQEDYAGARKHFEDAAMKTKDLPLEAKAWYNTGNCAFSEGLRQSDSDMEKALEFYRESVGFYATALEKDPDLKDAAHNMEIVRLYIKDLLDRIQKQKEEMEQMQEKMKEVVDSLLASIERQEGLRDSTLDLDDDSRRAMADWKSRIEQAGGKQKSIESSTSNVGDMLDGLFPSEVPEPVQQASSHLDSAVVDQKGSASKLEARDAGASAAEQELALDQMNKALELLTQGDNKDKQQGQQEQNNDQAQQDQQDQQDQQNQQEDQKQQQARSETARGILDEEKENRKKRKQQAAGGYKKVDKDW